MKLIRYLTCLVLAASFASMPMRGDTLLSLNAVTALGAGSSYAGASFKKCYAYVYSTAGSSAVVKVEGSTDNTFGHIQTLATITNPDVNGEYWGGACPAFIRLEVTTYVSGNITGYIERREPTP